MAPHARLSLPKEEKKELYLIQQFLVMQVHLFAGMAWNIELVVSDLTKVTEELLRPKDALYCRLQPLRHKSNPFS